MRALKEQPTISVSRINASGRPDRSEVVLGNSTLIKALTRRHHAELDYTAIPDKDCDVYRRRTIVMKDPIQRGVPYTKDEDLPNLDDLSVTDLPWIGMVATGPYGSRQFRSRNVLTAAVELVREFDGFLYALNCDVKDTRLVPSPVLITINGPTRKDAAYKLVTDHAPSAAALKEHLADAPEVPHKLADELVGLGFTRDGNRFFVGDGSSMETRIVVNLHGKIITKM